MFIPLLLGAAAAIYKVADEAGVTLDDVTGIFGSGKSSEGGLGGIVTLGGTTVNVGSSEAAYYAEMAWDAAQATVDANTPDTSSQISTEAVVIGVGVLALGAFALSGRK